MPHLERLGSHVIVMNYRQACVSPEALSSPLLPCMYTHIGCRVFHVGSAGNSIILTQVTSAEGTVACAQACHVHTMMCLRIHSTIVMMNNGIKCCLIKQFMHNILLIMMVYMKVNFIYFYSIKSQVCLHPKMHTSEAQEHITPCLIHSFVSTTKFLLYKKSYRLGVLNHKLTVKEPKQVWAP